MTRHSACLTLLSALTSAALTSAALTSAALATTFTGCSNDDPDPVATTMTAVTYNLGLAVGFVPASEARAPLTTAAVAALGADVLCLQEVWLPEHVNLMKAAASDYPSSIFMAPDAGVVGPAACSDADAEPLLTCVADKGCDQVCPDDLVDCVLTNCAVEFGMVPTECNACLQANVGQPLDDIEATCKSQSTEYAFGGSFGIGLLSKYPIKAQETLVFDSTTNRRAVIYAELETPLGPVHTFCTHLTAVFTDIPYPKPTGSWQEEQATQIDQLIALADEKAGADGQLMVMGDMNTGPAGSGYVAEVEDDYALFLAAGMTSPYVSDAGHPCTFCGDNPLVGNGEDPSVVLDHVFLRNVAGTTSSKRVMDGPIDVENCGVTGPSAYSDHYGVSVTVTR